MKKSRQHPGSTPRTGGRPERDFSLRAEATSNTRSFEEKQVPVPECNPDRRRHLSWRRRFAAVEHRAIAEKER
jgi:hypothetical protein